MDLPKLVQKLNLIQGSPVFKFKMKGNEALGIVKCSECAL